MKNYDKDELKNRVSMKEVLEAYGCKFSGNRCNAAWRNGDGQNVSVTHDGKTATDFVEKKSYDIFSFVAEREGLSCETDFQEIVTRIGDRFAPFLAKEQHVQQGVPGSKSSTSKNKIELPPDPEVETATDYLNGGTAEEGGISKQDGSFDPTMGFGIRPSKAMHKSAAGRLLQEGFEMVKRYKYMNRDGMEALWVERWEQPVEMGGRKSFLQRLPYAENYGGCSGVKCLYRWPELLEAPVSDTVYITEGEKCVDALVQVGLTATTNPGGAGKWAEEYNDSFRGRRVVVLADSDECGVEHAEKIAGQLMDFASSVKMVVPYRDKRTGKGDVVDFFASCIGKNHVEELQRLVDAAEEWVSGPLGRPSKHDLEMARALNKTALTNFFEEDAPDEEGESKKKRKVRTEKTINEIMHELHRRCLGFPAVVGGNIVFDYDRKMKRIVTINSEASLMSFIGRTQGHSYQYDKQFTTPRVLFEGIKNYSTCYSRISNYPEYPEREDTFYNPKNMDLPKCDKTHPYFNALMSRLNPATHEDAVLLKSMFITPMWSGIAGNTPLYIITSDDGQGAGKSTIINLINYLYLPGNPSFVRNFSPANFDDAGKAEQLKQTFISIVGNVNLKIITLENLENSLNSSGLAQAITQEAFLARLPYHTEDSVRVNDFMWVVTANSIKLSNDMASRALVVKITEPSERIPNFKEMAKQFIDEHRLDLFAEIYDIMSTPRGYTYKSKFRFPDHSEAVTARICETQEEYDAVMARINENADAIDDTDETMGKIIEIIEATLASLHVNPEIEAIFIPNDVLDKLKKKYGLELSEGIKAFLWRLKRSGNKMMLDYFDVTKEVKKINGKTKRGLFWNRTGMKSTGGKYLKLNLDDEIELKDVNV